MSVVRLEGSSFYWMHHPATGTNVDHYTMHASNGKGVAPVKLPEGFYCMVKRLSDKRWFWRIAHLGGFTTEQKGTVADRTTAMKEAETCTRKLIAEAPVPGVATVSPKKKEEPKKRSGSDSTIPSSNSKTNGVG